MISEIINNLKNLTSKKEKAFIFGLLKTSSLTLKILIITVLSLLIVPSLMYVFPIVKYVMIAIIIFFIYELVAKSFGNTLISFLFTGLICYFFVYRYLFLSSVLIVFYFFLGAGIMSVIVWGTSRFSKK
jgi:hypothetical protein